MSSLPQIKLSSWWLPSAFAVLMLMIATWETQYRYLAVGLFLILLTGWILTLWPQIESGLTVVFPTKP